VADKNRVSIFGWQTSDLRHGCATHPNQLAMKYTNTAIKMVSINQS